MKSISGAAFRLVGRAWSRLASHACVAIVLFGMAGGSAIASTGTVFSDLWWNPSESGWGVTVDQQENFMFLTFFIYRADGTPYWVTAELNKTSGSLQAFPIVYSGDVYENTGPYFGGAFNPAIVTNKKVGTATFTGTAPRAATLNYTINGVPVTKSIERQTLANINYSGIYLGGVFYTLFSCTNPANENQFIVETGTLTVTQSGTSFSMVLAANPSPTCNFLGTYDQFGTLGSVSGGTYSCTDGNSGTFQLGTMQWTVFGMSAALSGKNQLCSFGGSAGGITAISQR